METTGRILVRYDDGEEQRISEVVLMVYRADGSCYDANRCRVDVVERRPGKNPETLAIPILLAELESAVDFGRRTAPDPDVRAWPISRICEGQPHIQSRARLAFARGGYLTVGQVAEMTPDEIKMLRGIGTACAYHIERWLTSYGLRDVTP
jgi:hypothetical protein